MDAATFLSAVVDIALGVAGFAGIVAAVRQRQLAHWPTEQLLLLQILFTASAAAIVLALLPSFLSELGLADGHVWRVSSLALMAWILGALAFRLRQSRRHGVAMPIPIHVRVWGVISVGFQVYNLLGAGQSWPFLLGIMTLLSNGFSVFLLLVLNPVDEMAPATRTTESET